MAIFEPTYNNKSLVDDTEKLICIIENAQNVDKHTEYILRIQRGSSKESKWLVSRRYRDFASLHSALQPAGIDLPMPPKKLLGNMQPSFIAERQIALQEYMNVVLKHSILELSLPVRSFLDPSNYSLTLADQALQTVSIALRGDGRFELKEPLHNIGWRIRKHYFLVSHIHPGNITIDNHRPVLLDIENVLLGVPCVHRPHYLELRRCNAEFLDVYNFGRTLYELTFATPLESDTCDILPCGIPNDLDNVLRLCLSSSACKHGTTTLDMLLQHPLFNSNVPNGHPQTKVHFKVTAALKDELKQAVAKTEERLSADQKLVRCAKREVRIKEILGSEEEMKKQKRRKKRESVYKSSSSLADTLRSHSASTGSSPTPPALSAETSVCSPSPPAPTSSRSELLSAICSFDKNRLARINSS